MVLPPIIYNGYRILLFWPEKFYLLSKPNMTVSLSTWAPSHIPTSTVLSSIDPTHSLALVASLSSAIARAQTETVSVELFSLSRIARGAEASLTILGAQQVLATATAAPEQAFATQAIFNSTLNLKDLALEENLFDYWMNYPANIIYLVVFAVVFFFVCGMFVKSRYHWYNITFFAGWGLEFAGFLGRVLALNDTTNINYYLLQYISLTIAPAFIMGGIYFLFAQVVVIHGREYSVLKPMWYSYFFIATDVVSLLIQAGGGGAASIATQNHTDPRPGTNTMIAGIAFQVVAMTIFLVFWFEFLNRIYFSKSKLIREQQQEPHPLTKRSVSNYLKMLFHTKSTRAYKIQYLEPYYNPKFEHIRDRKLAPYFPLAITIAVVAIYIRCVYRVVELAQGFSGYLITHEVYIMVLDAFMMAIAGLIFIPFHPVLVLGAANVIRLATIKKNHDVKDDEEIEKVEDGHRKEKSITDDEYSEALNERTSV